MLWHCMRRWRANATLQLSELPLALFGTCRLHFLVSLISPDSFIRLGKMRIFGSNKPLDCKSLCQCIYLPTWGLWSQQVNVNWIKLCRFGLKSPRIKYIRCLYSFRLTVFEISPCHAAVNPRAAFKMPWLDLWHLYLHDSNRGLSRFY